MVPPHQSSMDANGGGVSPDVPDPEHEGNDVASIGVVTHQFGYLHHTENIHK